MCPRLHNRSVFYKYTTLNTCKIILRDKTIRWRSPSSFNDPFDCACSLDYGFPIEQAREPFIREIERIVFGKKETPGDREHEFFNQMNLLRKKRDKLPRRDFFLDMGRIFDQTITTISQLVSEIKPGWEEFMRQHRILCLSESYSSIPMWSHYSENHSGAVIRLRWVEELDNTIGAAIKVNYSTKMPAIVQTVPEFVKFYTGQIKISRDDLYLQYVRTKSKVWEYEKEWRVVSPPVTTGETLFEDRPLYPQEIDAVYFGCNTSEEDKAEIEGLLIDDLAHVELYAGKKDKYSYELTFERTR